VTGDRRFFARLITLLKHWIDQCRYPYGPHWCSALEAGITYQLGIRGDSNGLDGCRKASAGQPFSSAAGSVYQHLRFVDSFSPGFLCESI
jgi:hypothetical protein